MNVKRFANKVRKAGFAVLSMHDGDVVQDSMIVVTESVHIQVPTFGTDCCVVRQVGDLFEFYPPRKRNDILFADLQNALSK